ncbi:unnamed protein product [Calypogeia fissa]
MSGAMDWLLWRVLHLLVALSSALSELFSQSRRFISSFNAENSQVKDIAAGKPLTVAVVLENQEALDKEDKIPQLLLWLSSTNVSHVTLYDAQGILKRSQGQLQKALNSLETNDQLIRCYSEAELLPELTGKRYLKEGQTINNSLISVEKCDKLMESEGGSLRRRKSDSPVSADAEDEKQHFHLSGVSHMKVELLSLQDGKGSLVRAARHVCENAYKLHYAEKSTKGAKLTEDDINRSLQETGGEGPDPDLLLLFGMTRSLLGFPPWRLRLTEIVHMGSLKDLTAQTFVSALKDFAKKAHRYGR